MDDGAIDDGLYNMKGSTFTPNYDMFLWGWGGDPDPNFILSIFTTAQINSWSDCAWSDPQYDKLFLEQQTTIDPTKRADIVHQMEQIIYQQSPYIPTAYPESVEAYNYKDWQGWQSTPGKRRRRVLHLAGDGELHDRPPGRRHQDGSSSKALLVGVIVAIIVGDRRGRPGGDAAGARQADRRGGADAAGRRAAFPGQADLGRPRRGTAATSRGCASTSMNTKLNGSGGRGLRARRRPSAGSRRSPLRRLQGAHDVTTLSQLSAAALGARHDVIDGEVLLRAAVLAAEPVAGEDGAPRDALGRGARHRRRRCAAG